MKYNEIDLQCEDIMWFGVDKNGFVFECTSGGIGCVPPFVCRSKEETNTLINFFLKDMETRTTGTLLIPDNGSDLAEDCKTLVNKGIYCFDVAIDDNRPNDYKKVAEPTIPLPISDLPPKIKSILDKHVVDVNVRSMTYIHVSHAF